MKQSISYYIVLFVLKIKGIKSIFSQAPIDFLKLRTEDVHQPKGRFFRSNILRKFVVADSAISEVGINPSSASLIIYIHGGAFISGPVQHHWDTVKEIAKETGHKVWLCDYPKAPEAHIAKISDNIDLIYNTALQQYPATEITLIGDSVGGTLITCLVQRLIATRGVPPQKIILISPAMDASMSNPQISILDATDPMLSKFGVLSAKKMCAPQTELIDPIISPLYGDFTGFPETIVFVAENDITQPDQKLTITKLKDANVPLQVFEGKNMPHIWPLLPVMKEAKQALAEMIRIINR